MEIASMSQAMQLHAQILKAGKEEQTNPKTLSKVFTFSALSSSGDLNYARLILRSLQTTNSYYFNTLIRAHAHGPHPIQALSLFLSMYNNQNPHITPKPDKFTYTFTLKACAKLRRIHEGRQFHGLIHKIGFRKDRHIQNSLIHFYSSCEEPDCAYVIFEKMCNRDVVSWTSIIDGFVDDGRPIEAIRLFDQMVNDGFNPNDATVVSVLRACADIGAITIGQRIHRLAEERNLTSKANVTTALIDMYAKCGCIDSANLVFNETENKDVFCWTAMVSGLASHGRSEEAINLFSQMEMHELKPDERTITAVLSACRNVGWITKAFSYFRNMKKKYGVKPTIQHYGCMVDLLSRAGHLNDAEEFIKTMPIEPDAVLWRSLLWASKIHGDNNRFERLMKELQLLEMGSTDIGSYVLIGNIYASVGKWSHKAKVRELMNQNELLKPMGSSKIEVDGVVHEFSAGHSGHPEAKRIYRKLCEIDEELRENGYCPKLSEVLLDIDDEEKAFQLRHHSEKLAVAFGLINRSQGSDIRIVKNLRSCEDCHSFMKAISKVYERQIIVRDRIRFHYFKDGECACKDYW